MVTFVDGERTMEAIVAGQVHKAAAGFWGVAQCDKCSWQLMILCTHLEDDVMSNPTPCFDSHCAQMIDRFKEHECIIVNRPTAGKYQA